MCGVVVEKVRCKAEVAGSKPVDRVVHENWLRVVTLVEWAVPDWWGPLRINFLFSIFKISFLKTFMPCVFYTRQTLCRVPDKWHTAKVLFADAYLPCVFCRVQHTAKGLPWVFWPLPCA